MKILLRTSEDDFIRHVYGSTWAEKKSRFQLKMDHGDHFPKYFTVMNGFDGQWVEVDTEWLFTHSFNAIMDNNGVYDVQQEFVKAVDLEPEFSSIDEWIAAVQKRYDKDWPGTDCTKEMSFWKDREIRI